MERRNITYRENAASAVQKRLNQSSYPWACVWGGPKESCIRRACTQALTGKYSRTIVRMGYGSATSGGDAACPQITSGSRV